VSNEHSAVSTESAAVRTTTRTVLLVLQAGGTVEPWK
jgi:hypothetical protein